ncbi:hypothetical protein CONCODRAFT_78128 [Conidiobolus coronatus NRRL 28638]|uniref:AMP-activated protein kinase glycogen-binding domain-containing protein n=1 Tax=Conidiobolus coronatus (strain ATCC 28846 / CBS 209.66 / NRRL 28638) TaxID=796925 RepID=A0A137P9Y2_CONC2|nr:hypothetical protein CONCODRAFT_78128 [Conidiobolus coronatus NRRL 28638]|eukprot:KXN71816.1 hypothetical protein CONCODRAFT_78128 [Conidiobolus coronatus NRRL 28638]
MENENITKTDQLITLEHAENYQSVKVLGTFDNCEWEHLPMTLNKTQWEILLKLLIGKEYEFKFFVNDEIWLCSSLYDTKATSEGFENNILKVVSIPKKSEKIENNKETFNSGEYNEEELNTESMPILSPSNELNEGQVSEDESEEFNEDEDINVNQFSFIKTEDELENELETKALNDSDFDNHSNNDLIANLNEESNDQSINDSYNDHDESAPLRDLGDSWVHSMDMSTTLVKEDLEFKNSQQELDKAQFIEDNQNDVKLLESETDLNQTAFENLPQLKSEINETVVDKDEELKISQSNTSQINDNKSDLNSNINSSNTSNLNPENTKETVDKINDANQDVNSETSNYAENCSKTDKNDLEHAQTSPQVINEEISTDPLKDEPINNIHVDSPSTQSSNSAEIKNTETETKSGEIGKNSARSLSNSQNTLEISEPTTSSSTSSTCPKITVTSGSGKTSEAPSPSLQTENLSKKSSLKKRKGNKKDLPCDDNSDENDKKKQLVPKSFIWSLFDFFFLRTLYWALGWVGIKRQK